MCSYFVTLSLAPRQHLFCLFSLIFHFSGLEWDDSEYIDISLTYAPTNLKNELLSAFKRSGFANQSVGKYKLLPCSLGWFVNASSEDNNCKECPAGKLPLNLADNTSLIVDITSTCLCIYCYIDIDILFSSFTFIEYLPWVPEVPRPRQKSLWHPGYRVSDEVFYFLIS